MAKIIAVNAGSSSLKFQLFEMDDESVITSGVIERIGLEDSIFTIKFNGQKDVRTLPIPTHKEAVHLLLDTLLEKFDLQDAWYQDRITENQLKVDKQKIDRRLEEERNRTKEFIGKVLS